MASSLNQALNNLDGQRDAKLRALGLAPDPEPTPDPQPTGPRRPDPSQGHGHERGAPSKQPPNSLERQVRRALGIGS